MSDYAIESAAEPGGESEGAAESEPWNFTENVSREEWEQLTGNLNYLGSIAASVQEQQQAEQTQAAIMEWLGDEFEDPDGYEERRQELWRMAIDEQMAPYVQYFEQQQNARALAQAEAGLDQLLGAEAKSAGVELPADARQVVFDALAQLVENAVRDGMSVEEASVWAGSQEMEQLAVQLHVQGLIPKKPGNEFDVVKQHFPRTHTRTQGPPPTTAAQRAIIDRILR